MEIKDMPKLESLFIRETINGEYIVTQKIDENYKWVLEGKEDEVICMEKLNGTNVSIIIQDGNITGIFNRTARIPFFNKGKKFIIEGLLESHEKGYCEFLDGQYFGELIGEKVQGNPYKNERHLWIPFNSFGKKHLVYKSFHKYPKTFEGLSDWLKKPIEEGGIFSLYARMKGIEIQPEGVVFYNLKTGQMCKLRRDMFEWYKEKRHKE